MALERASGERGINAALDEPLLEGFGFEKPSRALRWCVEWSLRMRARAIRLLPRRRHPLLRTEMKQRSYPCGYALEQVGPPESAQTGGGQR